MKRKIVITLMAFTLMIFGNMLITNEKVYADTAVDANGLTWNFDIEENEAQNVYLVSGDYEKKLVIPNTIAEYPVTSISKDADGILKGNTKNRKIVTEVEIPSTVKSININAFSGFSSLKTLVLPSELETIGDNAFLNCTKITGLNLPNNLKVIGNYAFSNTGLTGTLNLPNGITSIGNFAFSKCRNLTGNLSIPDSVEYLGNNAFYNCSGLNGTLTTGTGLKAILGETFSGTNFARVNLGEITSLGYYSFYNYTDLWVNNEKENVTLSFNGISGAYKYPEIHWKNDTHKLEIETLPGIKLVHADTLEEITAKDYACETSFEFKLQIEEGYNYPDLQVIIIDGDNTSNADIYAGNPYKRYKFKTLLRDRKIYVQNMSDETDLALRMFITEVNSRQVSKSRVPTAKIENGAFAYLHTKEPVSVKTGDLVKFKIRVYNEATIPGKAQKIAVHIPNGLEMAPNNKDNDKYGWYLENGKAITTYLDNEEISANLGTGKTKYKDIEIVLKVTLLKNEDADTLRTTFAEIYESNQDYDSTPANIVITSTDNYRTEELWNSDNDSYLRCGEDDEDFDTIFIRGKVKVDYNIVIDKIDRDSRELLKGAKFALFNEQGTQIAVVESDKEGRIDFGGLSTYGDGTDIYYIQEVRAPEGYYLTDNKKVKVRVVKTILDEEKGLYSLKVYCDTQDYTIDTTRYEFTPIYNAEQLTKVGSGEIVEIDGVKFQYNIDTNYKLMNDIDISGYHNWEPINKELTCIIDGDGHKISGLTITGNKFDYSEIGLFRVFSGIIKNLELTNVNIAVTGYEEDAENISGKTGIGAFVGVMKDGYLINCKLSGSISAGVDNIGGFVGHTTDNGIVRIDNCTNEAYINGRGLSNNVGGMIGCAFGSVSVNKSVNNGKVEAGNNNTGGFVGFVMPSEYQELSVNTAFDEDNKIINLLVENITTSADYSVLLKEIDIDTEESLIGGIYSVYDGGKNAIEGLERLELDEIMKKILDKELRAVGLDTYYIMEDEPVKGYVSLTGVVRLDIERYWDDEAKCYKIRISTSVLTDTQFEEAESNLRSTFDRGDIFTDVKIEKANMNSEKAEFIDCTNNAKIHTVYYNVAGIVGKVYGYCYFENCNNTATIEGSNGKAAGMVADLYNWKTGNIAEINNCSNSGDIKSLSNNCVNTAGMVAKSISDIKIKNCINTGTIESHNNSGAAGMICDGLGYIEIESCINTGNINALGTNCDVEAGGMIAKNMSKLYYYDVKRDTNWEINDKNSNILRIKNCTNSAKITSGCHEGGLVGYSEACVVEITGCTVKNCDIEDIEQADKGGIAGFLRVDNAIIKDCEVENVNVFRSSNCVGTTYGCAGGIVGNWHYSSNGNATCDLFDVENCTVKDCYIQTKCQSTGGILGAAYSDGSGTFIARNCYVDNCELLNDCTGGSYSSTGGIVAWSDDVTTFVVEDCQVKDTSMQNNMRYNSGDQDVAGVCSKITDGKTYVISNTDIVNCDIFNNCGRGSSSCRNVSGFIGYTTGSSGCSLTITGCNLIGSNVTATEGNVSGFISVAYSFYNYGNNDFIPIQIINSTVKDTKLYSQALDSTCTVMSGMIAYTGCKCRLVDNEIDNLDVKFDTQSPAGGTNITGFFGMSDYKQEFINCNISNSKFYTKGSYGKLANVAGIAGYVSGNKSTFRNCNVNKCQFIADNIVDGAPCSGNVAGLAGCLNAGADIIGCNVKDCVINSKATTRTNSGSVCSTVAGLVGYMSNQNLVEDTSVENISLTGGGYGNAGVVAVCSEKLEMNNVSVKDINITDIGFNDNGGYNYQLRSIGGVVSSIKRFTGNNIEANDITIDSKAVSIGGFAGYIETLDGLSNVSVNNLNITNNPIVNPDPQRGKGSIAGLIGDLLNVNCSSIDDCSVKNATISSKCNNVSGFIGYLDDDVTIDTAVIDNIDIVNRHESTGVTGYQVGNVGGLVAQTVGSVIARNVDVNDSTITLKQNSSNNLFHVGGLLGYCRTAEFDNINLTNTTVKNENSNMAGGFVGTILENIYSLGEVVAEFPLVVTNSNVENVNIIGNSHTGSIAGLANKVTISNTDVVDTTIDGKDVSGILVGLTYDNTANVIEIVDTNIEESKITSTNQAGGVVGFTKSIIDIDGLILDDIDVQGNNCAGGIAGNTTSSLVAQNVIVKNGCSIKGNSHVGGLVGNIVGADLKDITINNADISTTGGFASGILGGAENTVSIEDVNVINNTEIKGQSHTGGIIGYANGPVSVEDVTVSNTNLTSLNESAGGIIGTSSSTFEGSNVTVSNIKSEADNHSAGIAGSVSSSASIENSSVSNVTLKSKNSAKQCLTAGYFGTTGGLTITDSSVSNADIDGYYHMGGVLAVGTINANGITLNDIDITMNKRDTWACMGGFVGNANGGSTIKNITATDINLAPNGVLSGGIAGISHSEISNVNISNAIITQDTYASAGGIVGIIDGGTLKDSVVDNVRVSAIANGSSYGDVGGAAGSAAVNITGVTVKNSTITSNEEVGGIVGVTDANIANCSVDNCTITSTAVKQGDSFVGGDAGGIVGASSHDVSNCTTTNSTITSNKLAGGIVGAGYAGYTTLSNLIVDGNTLVYGEEEAGEGDYIGAPDIYEPSISGFAFEEVVEEIPTEVDSVKADETKLEETKDVKKTEKGLKQKTADKPEKSDKPTASDKDNKSNDTNVKENSETIENKKVNTNVKDELSDSENNTKEEKEDDNKEDTKLESEEADKETIDIKNEKEDTVENNDEIIETVEEKAEDIIDEVKEIAEDNEEKNEEEDGDLVTEEKEMQEDDNNKELNTESEIKEDDNTEDLKTDETINEKIVENTDEKNLEESEEISSQNIQENDIINQNNEEIISEE